MSKAEDVQSPPYSPVESEKPRAAENTNAAVQEQAPSRLKYAIGVAALTFVIIGWVGTNFLTWNILKVYQKPFFTTVINTIILQFYFIFLILGDPLKPKKAAEPSSTGDLEMEEASSPQSASSPKNVTSPKSVTSKTSEKSGTVTSPKTEEPAEEEKPILPPLTLAQTAKLGLLAYALYFWMNYFTNVSFGLTSPGSASILASTCGFFTLLFGRLFGIERLSPVKILAVFISVGGVVVLGIHEFGSQDNKALGNCMALLGAAMYGIYSVTLKKLLGDESRVSSLTLFAFVGLYTMLFSAPFFLCFHLMGWETFELPYTGKIYMYLAINAVFGALIPNYLWNIAFLYTSQMVVAIGLSFTIPLTLFIEHVFFGQTVSPQKIGSAACVIAGFVLVNIVEIWPSLDISWRRVICLKDRE